jgi:myo-inositol-1(or 4)-monophosphatase
MKKTKTTRVSLNKILAQMIEWAQECGEVLNDHLARSYKSELKIINKGVHGVATEADVLSEKLVMMRIRQHYPDHKILSEEDAFTRQLKLEGAAEDEYLWLIDPLDGTNNFYNKIPLFAVSLALNKGNETLVGVVYNPVSQELFYAVKGKGAYLVRSIGNHKIKIRLKSNPKRKVFKEALLSANLTSKRVEKDLLKRFPEVRAMRRLGSAALEMSYVGAGMLDAYWEYRLQPWDMAAAGLICQQAGVKISTIQGGAYNPFSASVLVAHPTLHSALKNVINKH